MQYSWVVNMIMSRNNKLKYSLIIQSFLPLFIIIFVKYFDLEALRLFLIFLKQKELELGTDLNKIIVNIILIFTTIIIIIYSLITYLGFEKNQEYGFDDNAKKIKIVEDTTEHSLVFLVTYIIPLAIDDISSIRGLIIFLIIVLMLFMLMKNTNLYYQNPILTILGYKTFYFRFLDEEESVRKLDSNKLIAITKGHFDEGK